MTDSRAAQHHLPFYARVLAVLAPVFPDISSLVLHGLEEDFTKLMVRLMPSPRLPRQWAGNALPEDDGCRPERTRCNAQ